jgi:predicted GNAT family N-acyltransferase
MSPTIRTYQSSDKEDCIIAFKSNVPDYFTTEEIVYFEHFLDSFPHKEPLTTYFYVVELDSKIIGCGGFGDKDQTNHITLAWGLIHADFHKKGCGELLLKQRLNYLKHYFPKNTVYLDTTQYSFGFYEKYDFVVTDITNDYYAPGMHRYNMKLLINQTNPIQNARG